VKRDNEHLQMLSIFHYVLAGLTALGATIPVIHLGVGIAMITGAFGPPPAGPPPALGWVLVGVASFIILFGWTMAVCQAVAGRCLARRRRYTFCFVVACLSCLSMPLGTILGVFTLVVLCRPSVKEAFGVGEARRDEWEDEAPLTAIRRGGFQGP
jgi:hypothetical protein